MKPIRTILCPVDFTPMSERELALAGQLAERFGAGIVLHHNIASSAALGADWMYQKEHHAQDEAREAEVRHQLSALLAKLPPAVAERSRAAITYGALDQCVHGVAAKITADLIVIGTHGRTGPDHPCETERLIRHAPCPVLTTHDDAPDSWLPDLAGTNDEGRVSTVVPVDFSPHSVRALRYALALSAQLPLALTVFHVLEGGVRDETRAKAQLQEILTPGERGAVGFDVRYGRAADQILFEEEFLDARLLIMGAHAKGFIERVLSLGRSTAHDVLQLSPCPVWYVPASAG
jgi:universal stress protein A